MENNADLISVALPFLIVMIPVIVLALMVVGVANIISRRYRVKVPPGQVWISNRLSDEPVVVFEGAAVLSVFSKAEVMKIGPLGFEISRRGTDALRCKDDLKVDMIISIHLQPGRNTRDIIFLADKFGLDLVGNIKGVKACLLPQFEEALEITCREFDLDVLLGQRPEFLESFREHIRENSDLRGFVLEDISIDYMKQRL